MQLFKPNVKTLKEKRDIQGLIKALNYRRDESVRSAAAIALADLGANEAIPALKAALDDKSYRVYLVAVGSLGRLGETQLVESLLNVYLDMGSDLPQEPRALEKYQQRRRLNLEDLTEVGPAVVPYLLDFLKQEHDQLPLDVANLLARMNEVSAIPILIGFYKRNLHTPEQIGLQEVLLAFGEPALEHLRDTILDENINTKNTKNWYLKSECIQALAAFDSPQAAAVLIQFLEQRSKDYVLVKFACDGLVSIGDRSAVPILGTLLLEEGIKPSWQEMYAAALGTLGGPAAVEPLLGLMDAPKARYQAAYDALVKIGADAVDPLLALAADEDGAILKRTRAIETLGRIGDKRAAARLRVLKEHESKKVRDSVQAVLNRHQWPGWEAPKPVAAKPRPAPTASRKPTPKARPAFPTGMPASLPRIEYVSASSWQQGIGPGEAQFIKGRDSWSAGKYPTAVKAYKQALAAGLTPLYEAAARMNLGKIYLKQDKVLAAVEEFKHVLALSPQQASSVYDSATYLALIYETVAMSRDAQTCIALAQQAMRHVNYVVSAKAAGEVQRTVRKVYQLGI